MQKEKEIKKKKKEGLFLSHSLFLKGRSGGEMGFPSLKKRKKKKRKIFLNLLIDVKNFVSVLVFRVLCRIK